MAESVIFVTTIDKFNAPAGQYRIQGQALVDSSLLSSDWEVLVNFMDGTAIVNAACRDAAVAALEAAGFTISPANQKTLFASAVIA